MNVEKNYLIAGDLAKLREFQEEAATLLASPLMREGLKVRHQLSYNKEDGVKLTAKLPEMTKRHALLHCARPFLLNNETSGFLSIRNLVSRMFKDSPEVQRKLTDLKTQFQCKDHDGRMGLEKNGEAINNNYHFDLWLNSAEYHRDREKRDELLSVYGNLPKDFAEGVFFSILLEKLRAVFGLKRVIDSLIASD